MAERIRDHIRSNVVGYVALFIALSGTAYAIDGPLPGQNQVGSEDIINSEVKTLDVLNNTLSGADVNEASLGRVPSARFWGAGRWGDVWANNVTEDVPQINARTCRRLPAVEADTSPRDIVLGTVNGGSAPRPLPPRLTATFMLGNERVHLRLCNPTASNVPGFNLDYQFVVIRDTNPN
jgi:hypothetical protein